MPLECHQRRSALCRFRCSLCFCVRRGGFGGSWVLGQTFLLKVVKAFLIVFNLCYSCSLCFVLVLVLEKRSCSEMNAAGILVRRSYIPRSLCSLGSGL